MNTQNPLVSIIVRTKDRPNLLKRSLQSIAAQTYKPIEVILVNDGGCDLDIEELKSILGDVSLNYVRLTQNTGRAHAGNVGIENARGEYIGFLDDDDELYSDHLETLLNFLEQSDFKVAYTDTEMITHDLNQEEENRTDLDKVIFSKDFSYTDLIIVNYIPFNSLCFSKEVLNSVGQIDESFELYEDWDLLIRIGEKYSFHHITKITAIYNQWSKNLQINQGDTNHTKTVHLRVIDKHYHKLTPEMLLDLKQEKDRFEMDLTNINRTMNEKDCHILNLENSAEEKDRRISILEESLREKDRRISILEESLREKDRRISLLDNHILQYEESLRAKDYHILWLENSINLIKNTIGWKMLERFRRLRERILPQGKRRRRLFDLLTKTYKAINEQDCNSFLEKSENQIKCDRVQHPSPNPLILDRKQVLVVEKKEIDKNKFKVLFVVNHLDMGQRYRGFNMSDYLKLAGIESKVVFDNKIEQFLDSVFEYDIIVLYRLFYTPFIQELILKFRETGMPVAYDIDDYIFDISALPLLNVRGSSKEELGQVIQKHRKVFDLCDCCIVPTERLAELSRALGKETYVIRNGLSQELIDISESACFQKSNKDNIVKIGYFSGTTTHDKDFLVAADSVIKILEENQNVFLCIGGHLHIDERFNKFQDRIEFLPYVHWRLLPYNIAAVDINIVPLEINVFNNSKSELKYFEAALLRIPTVASPAESYVYAIEHAVNGFLAASAEEWYKYLRLLIEDRMLRQKIGEEAYKHTFSYYSPEAMSEKVIGVYHAVVDKYAMRSER